MTLECINSIITDNLAIQIDLTNIKSWDLNANLIVNSLNKWTKAVSNDMELIDFGLTAFDNGRLDSMNSGITFTENDTKLVLNRIGYNDISGGTYYSGYTITPQIGAPVGTYFSLDGGYLQGFFKLENYNYELFPPRYNEGITIETVIEILPESEGIFFLMGVRAEDKYSPFYSGETTITGTTEVDYGGKYTGYTYQFSGITTSEGNYLVAYDESVVNLSSFQQPEYKDFTILEQTQQLENIGNNIISFEITDEKKLKYKYVDGDGNLIQNESPNTIVRSGWTVVDIVFKPYDLIDGYDTTKYKCYERRKGDLIFYINGRTFWKIKDFDEFYFIGINNDAEKQLGVPYNISWGGGSFGLKHSWHFNNFDRNKIIQDPFKNDLFIEKYFNSSYIGNIQKLRIYDKALLPNEVLNNTIIESKNTLGYNITVSKGGRIIYR